MGSTGSAPPPHVIGREITVRGTLDGAEDLVVEGRIEGRVQLAGRLTVAPGATLEAHIEAQGVELHGEVVGDVSATESVIIQAGARIVGNVSAPRVVIALGAHVQGRVEMDVDLPAELAVSRHR
ncbi:MAG: polymer-forming cytoskeletal protein [Nannocystaceae bacterium]